VFDGGDVRGTTTNEGLGMSMALIGETKEEPSLESGILDYKTFGSRN
jgi:hypothetical protein